MKSVDEILDSCYVTINKDRLMKFSIDFQNQLDTTKEVKIKSDNVDE